MDTLKRWSDILVPTQFDLGPFTGDTQVSLKKQEHGKNSNLKVLIFFFLSRSISYLQFKAKGWGWGAYASHFAFKKVTVKACDWIFCMELLWQRQRRGVCQSAMKREREKERKICVRFLRYIWKNEIKKKCFQILRDFPIYQERHILPNERLLTFMNVTVQLQPIHMQSSRW